MKLLRTGSIAIGLLALGLGSATALAQHHGGHGGSGGHGFGGHGSFGHGSGSFRSHGGFHGGHGRSFAFGTFYAPGGYYYGGGYPYSGYSAYPYDYGYRRSHHRRCRTVWEWDDYAGEEVPVRVCRR